MQVEDLEAGHSPQRAGGEGADDVVGQGELLKGGGRLGKELLLLLRRVLQAA